MDLSSDLEIIDGLEILYIRGLKSLVISDLHLGYEGGMAKEGVLIPKANVKNILRELKLAVVGREIERLIVVGDIKNNFSKISIDDLNELREIAFFVKANKLKFELVKGNHDNFIDSYSGALGLTVHGEVLQMGEYLFAHGDMELKVKTPKATIVIGHEHPTIGIRTKTGTLERLRCFLYGNSRIGKSKLLVLPAIGYFETGSDINTKTTKAISPILAKAAIDGMRAIVVGQGSALDFGTIKKLRNIEL